MVPFSKRLELRFLAAIPSLLAVVLAILYLVPKYVAGLNNVMPLLPLIPVFFWGIMIARATPYWVVFAIGLVLDAAQGAPLGLSSLLYMLFLTLLNSQRRMMHKEGFLTKWGSLAVLFALISGINWLLLSWFNAHAMPVVPAVIQWGLTVAIYPVLHKAFDVLDQHMHTRKWQILHGR